MKNPLITLTLLATLLAASSAFATATPAAVWDGDFSSATNGYAIEEKDGVYTITPPSASTQVAVLVKYADFAQPTSAVVPIGLYDSAGNDFGIRTLSSSDLSIVCFWWQTSWSPTDYTPGTTATLPLGTGYVFGTFNFTSGYQNSSIYAGTSVADLTGDTCKGFYFSGKTFSEVTVGGPYSTHTSTYSSFGATIKAIAIFDTAVSAEDIADYQFPSEIAPKETEASIIFDWTPGSTPTGTWITGWGGENTGAAQSVIGPDGTVTSLKITGTWDGNDWTPYNANAAALSDYTLVTYGNADMVKASTGKLAVLWDMGARGSEKTALVKDEEGHIRLVQVDGSSLTTVQNSIDAGVVKGYHLFTVRFSSSTGASLQIDNGEIFSDATFTQTAGNGLQIGKSLGYSDGTCFEKAVGFVVNHMLVYDKSTMPTAQYAELVSTYPAVETMKALSYSTAGGTVYLPSLTLSSGELRVQQGTLEIPEGVVASLSALEFGDLQGSPNYGMNLAGTITINTSSTGNDNSYGTAYSDCNKGYGVDLAEWTGTGAYNITGTFNAPNTYVEVMHDASASEINVDGGTFIVKGLAAKKSGATLTLTNNGTLNLGAYPSATAAIAKYYGAGTVIVTGDATDTDDIVFTDAESGTTFSLDGVTLTLSGALSGEGKIVVNATNGGALIYGEHAFSSGTYTIDEILNPVVEVPEADFSYVPTPDAVPTGWISTFASNNEPFTTSGNFRVGPNGEYVSEVKSGQQPWRNLEGRKNYSVAFYADISGIDVGDYVGKFLVEFGGKGNGINQGLYKNKDGGVTFFEGNYTTFDAVDTVAVAEQVPTGYHLFAWSVDSEKGASFYVDGTLMGTDLWVTNATSIGFQIGSMHGGTYNSIGVGAGLAVAGLYGWDTVLTDAQMAELAKTYPVVTTRSTDIASPDETITGIAHYVSGETVTLANEVSCTIKTDAGATLNLTTPSSGKSANMLLLKAAGLDIADGTTITLDGATPTCIIETDDENGIIYGRSYVAEVNGMKYYSFADAAMAIGNGGTVTILEDYEHAVADATAVGVTLTPVEGSDTEVTVHFTVASTPTLVFSEIMPKPSDKPYEITTQAGYDKHGLESGWVEVYNTSTTEWADLGNYKFCRTNRGKKGYQADYGNFPSVMIGPGCRFTFYTSERYSNSASKADSAFEHGSFDGAPIWYDGMLIWGDKVNPKKFPYVTLLWNPTGVEKATVIDDVIIPSDTPEGNSIIVGEKDGGYTKRWLCASPTFNAANTATNDLVKIGPNVGPLYGVKHSLTEFGAVPPAKLGEAYTVTLDVNPVYNGTSADAIAAVTLVYRTGLDDNARGLVPMTSVSTNKTNGITWSADIPATAIPTQPGQLIQWKTQITDASGNVWVSPSFMNSDDGYEWFGTITEPSADQMSANLSTYHIFATSDVADTPGKNVSSALMNIDDGGAHVAIYDSSTSNYYDYVQIDLRGNTSKDFIKKSHGIRFAKVHPLTTMNLVTGKKIEEIRKTSFISEFADPSYMRQMVAFWLWDKMENKVPFDFPVRLNLNGEFYQLAFNSERFTDELIEDVYKFDKYGYSYKNVGTLESGSGTSAGGIEKKTPDDGNDDDISILQNELRAKITAASSATTDNAALTKVVVERFDLPAWLNYLASARITHETDDVWANISMYLDDAQMLEGSRGTGTWMPLGYDFNLSFGQWYYNDVGNGRSGTYMVNQDWFKSHPLYGGIKIRARRGETGSEMSGNYGIESVLQSTKFRRLYLRRLRTLMDQELKVPGTARVDTPFMVEMDKLCALMKDDAIRDRELWGPLGTYSAAGAPEINIWGEESAQPSNIVAGIDEIWEKYVGPRREHLYVTHSVTNTAYEVGYGADYNAGIPEAQSSIESLKAGVSAELIDGGLVIKNTNAEVIDLSDWVLEGAVAMTLPAGTVIDQGTVENPGMVYVVTDRKAYVATNDMAITDQVIVGNATAGEGESITLTAADGTAVIAPVTQTEQQKYLRLWGFCGAPKEGDDGEGEFIILTNINLNAELDVSGVEFQTEKTTENQGRCHFTLATGTTIPAGGYLRLNQKDIGWTKITNGVVDIFLKDSAGNTIYQIVGLSQKVEPTSVVNNGYFAVYNYETDTWSRMLITEAPGYEAPEPPAPEVDNVISGATNVTELAGDSYVLSNATLSAAVTFTSTSGVTLTLVGENTLAGITSTGSAVTIDGEGTLTMSGNDTLIAAKDLTITSGTLNLTGAQKKADKKLKLVTLTGNYQQTGGTVYLALTSLATVEADKNTIGLYWEGAACSNCTMSISGGYFEAVLNAEATCPKKCAAFLADDGATVACTIEGGKVYAYGTGAGCQFVNTEGTLEIKKKETVLITAGLAKPFSADGDFAMKKGLVYCVGGTDMTLPAPTSGDGTWTTIGDYPCEVELATALDADYRSEWIAISLPGDAAEAASTVVTNNYMIFAIPYGAKKAFVATPELTSTNLISILKCESGATAIVAPYVCKVTKTTPQYVVGDTAYATVGEAIAQVTKAGDTLALPPETVVEVVDAAAGSLKIDGTAYTLPLATREDGATYKVTTETTGAGVTIEVGVITLGKLRISEICPKDTTLLDGKYETGWVELVNSGDQEADLADYELARFNRGKAAKASGNNLPSVKVAPGERVVIYCNEYFGKTAGMQSFGVYYPNKISPKKYPLVCLYQSKTLVDQVIVPVDCPDGSSIVCGGIATKSESEEKEETIAAREVTWGGTNLTLDSGIYEKTDIADANGVTKATAWDFTGNSSCNNGVHLDASIAAQLVATNSYTVDLWFMIPSNTGSGNVQSKGMPIFESRPSKTSPVNGIIVYIDPLGELVVQPRNAARDAKTCALDSDTRYDDGNWHHLVLVSSQLSTGVLRVVVDGTQCWYSEMGVLAPIQSDKPLYFGRAGDSTSWFTFKGYIADVKLYSGSLITDTTTATNPTEDEEAALVLGDATRRFQTTHLTKGAENNLTDAIAVGPQISSLYGVKDAADPWTAFPQATPATAYTVTLPVNPVDSANADDAIVKVELIYRADFETASSVEMAKGATDKLNGQLWTADIPADAIPAAGHLVRWAAKITDKAGNVWRAPSFNDPDGSYEWYGTIVTPTEEQVSEKLQTFHLFGDSKTADSAGNGSTGYLMNKQADAISGTYPYGARIGVYDSTTGLYYDNVKIDLRGNSTASLKKKSHGVRFNKSQPLSCTDPITGTVVDEVRKTSWIAEYPDPTYIRQSLSFKAFRDMGNKVPFAYPVRLNMNGTFYELADHSNRFTDELIEDYYGMDPEGYSYKSVGQLNTSLSTTGGGIEKKTPDDGNEQDYTQLRAFVNSFADKVPSDGKEVTAVTKKVVEEFNLPAWINYLACARVTQECDDVWANLCVYYDVNDTDTWMPLAYDLNLSWGAIYNGDVGGHPGAKSNDDNFKSHPLYGGLHIKTTSGNCGFEAVYQSPKFRRLFLRRLRTAMDKLLQEPNTSKADSTYWQYCENLATNILADATTDRAKWGYPTGAGMYTWDSALTPNEGMDDLWNNYFVPRRVHLYETHSYTNTAKGVGYGQSLAAGIPAAQKAVAELKEGFSAEAVTGGVVICNANDEAVDMSGWVLAGPVAMTLPAGTVIDQAIDGTAGEVFVVTDRKSYIAANDAVLTDQVIVGNATAGDEDAAITLTAADGTAVIEPPKSAQQLYLRLWGFCGYPDSGNDGEGEFVILTNLNSEAALDIGGATVNICNDEKTFDQSGCVFTIPSGTTIEKGGWIRFNGADGLWTAISDGSQMILITDANGATVQSITKVSQKSLDCKGTGKFPYCTFDADMTWAAMSITEAPGYVAPVEPESNIITGEITEAKSLSGDAFTLSNATISAALTFTSTNGVALTLVGANTATAITCAGSALTFEGDGTLTMNQEQVENLITAKGMTVKSGTLNLTATQKSKKLAVVILTGGDYLQTGGTVNLTATGVEGAQKNTIGLYWDKTPGNTCTISGGTFNANMTSTRKAYAIMSEEGACVPVLITKGAISGTLSGPNCRMIDTDGTLTFKTDAPVVTVNSTSTDSKVFKASSITIKKSTITVDAQGSGTEIFSADDFITVDAKNAKLDLVSDDDCFSAQTNITISAGTIVAKSISNDVLDSNGDLTISGKDTKLILLATAAGHEGIDCDPEAAEEGDTRTHKLAISGGIVYATGGTGAQWHTPEANGQGYTIIEGDYDSEGVLKLVTETTDTSRTLTTFTVPEGARTFFISPVAPAAVEGWITITTEEIKKELTPGGDAGELAATDQVTADAEAAKYVIVLDDYDTEAGLTTNSLIVVAQAVTNEAGTVTYHAVVAVNPATVAVPAIGGDETAKIEPIAIKESKEGGAVVSIGVNNAVKGLWYGYEVADEVTADFANDVSSFQRAEGSAVKITGAKRAETSGFFRVKVLPAKPTK